MQSPSQYPYGAPHQPPKSSSATTWLIILFVGLPALIAVIGILAVLAIFGVRKYIGNAKAAEARVTVGAIGADAVAAFESRQRLCESASTPVPALVQHGMKYQSTTQEWQVDSGRDAGFACLKFEMSQPQYFQYDYHATSSSISATARGDLDADGTESSYELQGTVSNGRLVLAPSLLETNPTE